MKIDLPTDEDYVYTPINELWCVEQNPDGSQSEPFLLAVEYMSNTGTLTLKNLKTRPANSQVFRTPINPLPQDSLADHDR